MSDKLSDYDYDLPRELIAGRPLPAREDSRLMIVRRQTGTIEQCQFRELRRFVGPDELLVLNDTKVLPARLFSDDGVIEFLLLERIDSRRWRCLTKPSRKTPIGSTFSVAGTEARVEA